MQSRSLGQFGVSPLLAILFIACSESVVEPARTPGMRIIAPITIDTVGTRHDFRIELINDDGSAAVGELVQFTVHATEGLPDDPLELRAGITGFFTKGSTGLIDAEGSLVITARYTFIAGGAHVRVTIPSRALTDSVFFTVQPGAPRGIRVLPADTAVLAGASYALRANLIDEYGNARTDPLSYMVADGPATVSTEGLVSGEAYGRVVVVASGGGFVDRAHASVVPDAVLAAFAPPGIRTRHEGMAIKGIRGGIFVFRSDGTDARMLWEHVLTDDQPEFGGGLWPTWAPSGSEIAFAFANKLSIVDHGGAVRDVFTESEPPVSDDDGLQYSADGGWIYFTRGFDSWRVRPDGSGPEQLVTNGLRPSPSPDGEFIVFHSGPRVSDASLRRFTLATGIVTLLEVPGYSAHWMRAGGRIAYLGGNDDRRVHTVLPNGDGPRLVGEGHGAPHGFSPSPDGEWYVGSSGSGLQIVEIATGLVLPLNFRSPERQILLQPSWGPTNP